MSENAIERLERERAELDEQLGGEDEAKRKVELARGNTERRQLVEERLPTLAELKKMSAEQINALDPEVVNAVLSEAY